MKNKGFVISTDSFLGLTLLSVVIIFSLFYLSQIDLNAWSSINLINNAKDIVTVLEKSNTLENSVLLESNELIINKLNSTSQRICFEVIIYEKNSLVPKVISLKTGCNNSFSESYLINRTFVADSNFYLSTVRAWYK